MKTEEGGEPLTVALNEFKIQKLV